MESERAKLLRMEDELKVGAAWGARRRDLLTLTTRMILFDSEPHFVIPFASAESSAKTMPWLP
jgi:hypothetical protein